VQVAVRAVRAVWAEPLKLAAKTEVRMVRQLHQRFSRAFIVQMSFPQLFLCTYIEKKLPKQYLYKKSAQKMLMKLTP
jgi:hypothetical protein